MNLWDGIPMKPWSGTFVAIRSNGERRLYGLLEWVKDPQ